MARYIDADALEKQLNKYVEYNDDGEQEINADDVFITLHEQPTADVVKIVRCKGCIYLRNTGAYSCDLLDFWLDDAEGFCMWGERREDGEIH